MTATFYVGDVLDVLGKLPENSVDLVLSSPPFLALRSYLPADHPLKEKEGGSQSTPGEYIDWLIDVVEACDRVLAPHGSLCFELGDTYAGSGGAGGDYAPEGLRGGQPDFVGSGRMASGAKDAPQEERAAGVHRFQKEGHRASIRNMNNKIQPGGKQWPLPKSLSLIPESFRFAMVYGFNPFTGRQTERWRLRNVIRWVRPNPPVGALGDKFRPATSELMVFCKSAKRYFDLDSVREPFKQDEWHGGNSLKRSFNNSEKPEQSPQTQTHAGAPPLDWWNIPPGGYEGAHYACVDETTEALTPDGWKSHKELEDGDLIAAYDPRTDLIKWETAKFVRYDVVDESLVCIEKEQTSQRLTENHRMLVKSRKRPEPFVKLAGEVSSGYDLPLSAPWGEAGAVNGPGVVKAALLGWFITEGGSPPTGRQALIYQSSSANPEKVDQIRQLLEWSGAPFTERVRDRGDEFPGKGIQHTFAIHNSDFASWLRVHHKRLPLEYVFQWPRKDAKALFDAMVDGDGHRRADGRISFIQKDKDLADAFQCLAIRLGYRAVTKYRPSHNIYTVYVSENRWVTLRGTDGARKPIPRETYTGVVWCPQVNSTFWLARRNGKPFITGNTWPPELLVKPIKAMCPEKVCRTCGEARRRINSQLDQTRQAIAAALRERRLALGLDRRDFLPLFIGHYKNEESVLAQVSNWELAKNIPVPDDWALLRERLGIVNAEFDALIDAEGRWNDAEYIHINDHPSGNTQDAKGRVYQRLPARKDRIPPERFTDCGHDDYRPGVVLDCFGGSGTTAAVATGYGRDCVLIDLDERNYDLALERVGPLVLQRGEVAA